MFGVIHLIMHEEYSESYPRIIASLSFLTAGIQGRGNLSDAVYKAQTSRPHKLDDASKRWLSKLAAQVGCSIFFKLAKVKFACNKFIKLYG